MVNLSIIIISYNTKKITEKCLKTVVDSLSNSPEIKSEIIIVDNNSHDGSREMLIKIKNSKLKIKNLKFKVILNKKNLGYGKANNLAVKKAEGKYLLFLNSDIEVINEAITSLFHFYQENEKRFQFVGGKLLNTDLTSQPSCGPFYSLPVVFGALFLKGDYWGLTRWSPKETKEVDWVSGACFMTKKDYFNQVGGFDENIFMYMDEIDFFFRAKKIGFKVGFYPRAKFIHLGSASSGNKAQPIIQVFRGLNYFYKKHYPPHKQKILKIMLKLKALISIFIGKIIKNQYLITTYEQALAVAEKNR